MYILFVLYYWLKTIFITYLNKLKVYTVQEESIRFIKPSKYYDNEKNDSFTITLQKQIIIIIFRENY